MTVIAAPLRVEAFFLRRARTPVVRTGMGPRRSLRSRVRFGTAAVVVAGVAGGLRPGVEVGDVVVASEVVAPDGTATPCAPGLLVEDLRRAGLTVHYGPICCVPRLRSDPSRGALAVEMESCWLAPPSGVPFAVVRAISDSVAAPLLRPSVVRNGLSALRALQRAVPALDVWAGLHTTLEVS
jgi:4-hydroxy-3-methylbut-2-enyl diphosphate reductase